MKCSSFFLGQKKVLGTIELVNKCKDIGNTLQFGWKSFIQKSLATMPLCRYTTMISSLSFCVLAPNNMHNTITTCCPQWLSLCLNNLYVISWPKSSLFISIYFFLELICRSLLLRERNATNTSYNQGRSQEIF